MSLPDQPAGLPVSASMTADISPRRRKLPLGILIPIALVAVLLLAVGAYTAINLPRQCGLFGAARHGLVCEAPIPSGAVYQTDASKDGLHVWSFIDAATSYQRLHDFFAQQLPDDGWRCVADLSSLTPPLLPGDTHVLAMGEFGGIQSGQALTITFVYGRLTAGLPQTSGDAVASMQIVYGLSAGPSPSCAK